MNQLAVSNIAWSQHDDPELLTALRENGVAGIEVAPTKIWPAWQGVTPQSVNDYRRFMDDQGFCVPSMQALVYGKPELTVFGDGAEGLIEHMKLIADIGAGLGATKLVFGAPKNRRREDLDLEQARAIATDVFRKIADICADREVVFCLEPNPSDYHCDFINNAAEGLAMVTRVDSPGFALHLDAAGMFLAKDNAQQAVADASSRISHFHASEPFLGHFADPQSDHRGAAAGLREIDYRGWVSIEMRATETPLASVLEAVNHVKQVYFP